MIITPENLESTLRENGLKALFALGDDGNIHLARRKPTETVTRSSEFDLCVSEVEGAFDVIEEFLHDDGADYFSLHLQPDNPFLLSCEAQFTSDQPNL